MNSFPDRIAVHVHYTGRVQGVGFRATTADLAQDAGVQGWIRNLSDGRVEMWAEGPEAIVSEFLNSIRSHFAANIRGETVTSEVPTGRTNGFAVVG